MNPATACARVLLDELVRCGLRDLVLCPGSRSAALAYAAQDLDRAGLLRLHVRVDERSAGFLALGLAKVSRRPVAVVTTSGTAVANLHPAVLEAAHAHVPLLVLSADRPPELRGTGANQTMAQPGLFGGSTRWSADLGTPDATSSPTQWRSSVVRAVAAATGALGGMAGPAHLNVPLREPFTPDDVVPGAALDGAFAGRPDGAPWVTVAQPSSTTRPGAIAHVGRTLVVVGDLPEPGQAAEAVAWAARRGYPVVAEPFGAHDRTLVLPHGPVLLGVSDWLDRHEPERVITIGRITLSRNVGALLRRPGVRVETVTPTPDWTDPSHVVAAAHPFAALAERKPATPDAAWAAAWRDAGAAVARAIAGLDLDWTAGPRLAATIVASLPAGATLFVGSSNAARDVDAGAAGRRDPVTIVASRGLAGIDGCVSTAAGIALAGDGPTYALLGDLTFVHDANGLAIGPGEPRPDLTIVVVNDGGGGIFSTLEYGDPERAGDFPRIFTTPTGTDLAALCAAHGVPHVRVEGAAQLAAEVAAAPSGLRVVEVAVEPRHREVAATLAEAARGALAH
ncbi:2-succinyl-5-enolpyruvyl-6-hydroxy-3-cyclohexene-1-carboxylic-acid synthase [Janibacter sp. G1551]|uniref:2-succinyl-5-enolpyruvyl-6-hydroxy-3- cyclohexene-1-carboxylic-acid synthase n=1 Tax=Janibacter sp. G1551 TaxID=3420440 RepID=UPI003CFD236B